jgi:hypothetical protein
MISFKIEIIDQEDIEVLDSLIDWINDQVSEDIDRLVEDKVRQHFDRAE